jgi:hypothetical protein
MPADAILILSSKALDTPSIGVVSIQPGHPERAGVLRMLFAIFGTTCWAGEVRLPDPSDRLKHSRLPDGG